MPLVTLIDQTGSTAGSNADQQADPRPRRRRRKGLIAVLVVLAVLAVMPLSIGWYLEHRLSSQIGRIDGVFDGLQNRPTKPGPGMPGADAENILVTMGTDTPMVVHIDGNRDVISVVSIPRASWVQIPGHGRGTIASVSSYGAPSLTVATIEKLTDIRIDHVAVLDRNGLRELTDRVGGVDIEMPQTVVDAPNQLTWTAGRNHVDGKQSLLYIRHRDDLADDALAEVERQQAFLRSVMEANLHTAMRKNPRMLYGFLDTVAGNLSVDSDWSTASMASLVLSMRDFRSANLRFVTVPTLGTAEVGSQRVVRLDETVGREFWDDLRADRAAGWSAVRATS